MKRFTLPRKDAIVLSAIEIIDELGLQALSTKELASRQKISESALYRHFKSKDDIVMQVLKYFSKFDRAILHSAQQMDGSAKQRIIFYIKSFVEYYENFRALTALLFSYEPLRHYNQETKDKVESIFADRFKAVAEILAVGQQKGELTAGYTPKEFAEIILGTCQITILRWRINDYNFAVKDTVLSLLERLFAAVEIQKKP
ncbi:TetR/AcrR family transcriptional regulator [Sporomusa acidovorans]|uniref:Fatty acid metabolism regulator protein n=1 Tax=Sporomusa acidovorans (strain ATCC 49682 / DSM 3132 / Mol) TaxID=1123286 RepID=A0ABZ3J8D7_SPOA4|nr:TetR/AcrR family transcriptional regulator [Sporomusa acidovorans]OZC16642.1 fatty acid metabolism regulator protein [Sporomusa acidovorans DSM 3132]SDE07456.1 transcriptional regulator, TetR family [Sporomusa acidovorans]